VRRFRYEVRGQMNYRKNDRWPFYSALQRQKSPMRYMRDFRSPAIFEFFNTIRQSRTSRLRPLTRCQISDVPPADRMPRGPTKRFEAT
jgi:hypothetical protein